MQKDKKIKLFATQIPQEEDELEENEVYVEFEVKELLDNIEAEDICNYTKVYGYRHEDDFESFLDDMIDHLERCGYTILEGKDIADGYDYVDNCLFEDISSVFESLSCAKRQELRNLVINFK
jgi:hypothetical protein